MIGIVSQASNIKKEEHPEYTKETFLLLYPQFRGVLPDAALDMYVDLGLSCVNYKRFNRMWKTAIGLFIAHFSPWRMPRRCWRLLPRPAWSPARALTAYPTQGTDRRSMT